MSAAILSPLEREVLEQAANGKTIPEIAAMRGCSRSTVERIRKRIFGKLGARNIAQAMKLALERPAENLSDGQLRAFHAKANAVDSASGRSLGTAKREALEAAATQFGFEFASSTQLTSEQASWTLDWLDARRREGVES